MHIPEEDAVHLRQWIKKKLRDNSDADPDVLAEYVVALLQSNVPEDDLKATSADNLKDFLRGDVATNLVDDIFETLRTKSYKPGHVPTTNLRPNATAFNPPTGPAISSSNGFSTRPRKRTYNDSAMDTTPGAPGRGDGDARPIKQMRWNNPAHLLHNATIPLNMSGWGLEPPMNGTGLGQSFNPLDTANAIMSFPPMQPLNPAFPLSPLPLQAIPGMAASPASRGEPCRDYDTKGFCARGSSCPYDHGSDRIVVPNGPAADNAIKFNQQMLMTNPFLQSLLAMSGMANSPGLSRETGSIGHRHQRRRRASISATGVSDDPSNKILVIENIPEKYLSESAVRKFFQKFGTVEEVKMQNYRHLAIVRFANRTSARVAYECPDVVFENRFVKVFWYKSDKHGSLTTGTRDESKEPEPHEEDVDPEALQQKLAEAQRTHEDKSKRLEEHKVQKDELDAKVRKLAGERKKLADAIAAKEKPANGAQSPSLRSEGNDEEALKAKLAQLEAEAESLGLDPTDPYNSITQTSGGFRGRGRGGYYTRGFAPRARSYRGIGYRGKGGFGTNTGAVMRLDNRPKKVVVSIAPGSSEDETMRQWLLNNWEVDTIDPHPAKSDSQVVSFKERYMAESFIAQAEGVLGSITLSWYTDSTATSSASTKKQTASELDVPMSDAHLPEKDVNGGPRRIKDVEGDLDVAEDDYDEWR